MSFVRAYAMIKYRMYVSSEIINLDTTRGNIQCIQYTAIYYKVNYVSGHIVRAQRRADKCQIHA